MRIVHLFANWKWTGPAEPAVNLAAGVMTRGHEVTFVPGRPVAGLPCHIADEAKARGLPVREGLVLDKHYRPLVNHRDVRHLIGWFRETPPDVLHVHTLNDHLVGGAAARRAKLDLPVVRSIYDGEPPLRGWRTLLAFRKRTDALISASESVRAATVERFRLGDLPSETIDVPVDIARFDPGRELPDLRAHYGIEPGDLVIGIVARMQRHRRFDVLFEAIRRVRRDLPHIRLLIVGRGTHQNEVGVAAAAAAGVTDRVAFTGYRTGDEFVATLAAMDIKVFLHPGSDGSCRAVREALAMGKPVIAARMGMLPEIVADGETGILVPHEPARLADAIRSLADPDRRKGMSDRARSEASRRFDPAAQARAVESIYSSLVSGI